MLQKWSPASLKWHILASSSSPAGAFSTRIPGEEYGFLKLHGLHAMTLVSITKNRTLQWKYVSVIHNPADKDTIERIMIREQQKQCVVMRATLFSSQQSK